MNDEKNMGKSGEDINFLFLQEDHDKEKGVIVLREYDDFEWLYHCLTTQNNVDAVVVS